jgi:hypothetical protein
VEIPAPVSTVTARTPRAQAGVASASAARSGAGSTQLTLRSSPHSDSACKPGQLALASHRLGILTITAEVDALAELVRRHRG